MHSSARSLPAHSQGVGQLQPALSRRVPCLLRHCDAAGSRPGRKAPRAAALRHVRSLFRVSIL